MHREKKKKMPRLKKKKNNRASKPPVIDQSYREPYKHEVLGLKVQIKFIYDVYGHAMFFEGQITRARMHLDEKGLLRVEHFIQFNDGDERWFDLVVEEDLGRLKWPGRSQARINSVAAEATTAAMNPMQHYSPGKNGSRPPHSVAVASATAAELASEARLAAEAAAAEAAAAATTTVEDEPQPPQQEPPAKKLKTSPDGDEDDNGDNGGDGGGEEDEEEEIVYTPHTHQYNSKNAAMHSMGKCITSAMITADQGTDDDDDDDDEDDGDNDDNEPLVDNQSSSSQQPTGAAVAEAAASAAAAAADEIMMRNPTTAAVMADPLPAHDDHHGDDDDVANDSRHEDLERQLLVAPLATNTLTPNTNRSLMAPPLPGDDLNPSNHSSSRGDHRETLQMPDVGVRAGDDEEATPPPSISPRLELEDNTKKVVAAAADKERSDMEIEEGEEVEPEKQQQKRKKQPSSAAKKSRKGTGKKAHERMEIEEDGEVNDPDHRQQDQSGKKNKKKKSAATRTKKGAEKKATEQMEMEDGEASEKHQQDHPSQKKKKSSATVDESTKTEEAEKKGHEQLATDNKEPQQVEIEDGEVGEPEQQRNDSSRKKKSAVIADEAGAATDREGDIQQKEKRRSKKKGAAAADDGLASQEGTDMEATTVEEERQVLREKKRRKRKTQGAAAVDGNEAGKGLTDTDEEEDGQARPKKRRKLQNKRKQSNKQLGRGAAETVDDIPSAGPEGKATGKKRRLKKGGRGEGATDDSKTKKGGGLRIPRKKEKLHTEEGRVEYGVNESKTVVEKAGNSEDGKPASVQHQPRNENRQKQVAQDESAAMDRDKAVWEGTETEGGGELAPEQGRLEEGSGQATRGEGIDDKQEERRGEPQKQSKQKVAAVGDSHAVREGGKMAEGDVKKQGAKSQKQSGPLGSDVDDRNAVHGGTDMNGDDVQKQEPKQKQSGPGEAAVGNSKAFPKRDDSEEGKAQPKETKPQKQERSAVDEGTAAESRTDVEEAQVQRQQPKSRKRGGRAEPIPERKDKKIREGGEVATRQESTQKKGGRGKAFLHDSKAVEERTSAAKSEPRQQESKDRKRGGGEGEASDEDVEEGEVPDSQTEPLHHELAGRGAAAMADGKIAQERMATEEGEIQDEHQRKQEKRAEEDTAAANDSMPAVEGNRGDSEVRDRQRATTVGEEKAGWGGVEMKEKHKQSHTAKATKEKVEPGKVENEDNNKQRGAVEGSQTVQRGKSKFAARSETAQVRGDKSATSSGAAANVKDPQAARNSKVTENVGRRNDEVDNYEKVAVGNAGGNRGGKVGTREQKNGVMAAAASSNAGQTVQRNLVEDTKKGKDRGNGSGSNDNTAPGAREDPSLSGSDGDDEGDPYKTFALPKPMPGAIADIIRFMDKMEPEKNYYERQKDRIGSCSGTRDKLVRFARRNPRHPAVKHWLVTKRWTPPNREVLIALMELIKTLIE